jgi:hypothetical protein
MASGILSLVSCVESRRGGRADPAHEAHDHDAYDHRAHPDHGTNRGWQAERCLISQLAKIFGPACVS